MPFTPHINRNGQANGRYAILLDPEELDDADHLEIERRAYQPVFEISEPIGRRLTLPELIFEIGIKLAAPETMLKPIIPTPIDVQTEGSAARYLGSLGYGFCPGVVNELKRRNPEFMPPLPQRCWDTRWRSLSRFGLRWGTPSDMSTCIMANTAGIKCQPSSTTQVWFHSRPAPR